MQQLIWGSSQFVSLESLESNPLLFDAEIRDWIDGDLEIWFDGDRKSSYRQDD
jgi:hypothetical protein